MAIIYYPANAVTYVRRVLGGQMIEQYIGVAPDQIIILSGSTVGAAVDFITASYALTYEYMFTSSFSSQSYFSSQSGVALEGGAGLILQTQIFS